MRMTNRNGTPPATFSGWSRPMIRLYGFGRMAIVGKPQVRFYQTESTLGYVVLGYTASHARGLGAVTLATIDA